MNKPLGLWLWPILTMMVAIVGFLQCIGAVAIGFQYSEFFDFPTKMAIALTGLAT